MPHHAPSLRVASDTRPRTLFGSIRDRGPCSGAALVQRRLVLARREFLLVGSSCSSGVLARQEFLLVRTLRSSAPGVWSIMYYPSCTSQGSHRDADETVLSWLAGSPATPAAVCGPAWCGAWRCRPTGGRRILAVASRRGAGRLPGRTAGPPATHPGRAGMCVPRPALPGFAGSQGAGTPFFGWPDSSHARPARDRAVLLAAVCGRK
jgi:hypothetical protein